MDAPFEPKSHPPAPLLTAQRYGLAVLSISLALGVAILLQGFHIRSVEIPLVLFAIAISAWYGGPGPAAVALILATAGFNYFFTEPLHTLLISSSDLPYFVVFAAFALLVTSFSVV